MTARRVLGPLGCLLLGVALFALARYVGRPFDNIAWGLPVLGVAAALLVARVDVDREGGRIALVLGAALAFIAASIASFSALWTVAVAAWEYAHPPGIRQAPFAVIDRLGDYAAYAWDEAWWVLLMWGLLALAPLGAGIVLARLTLVPLFAPSRDVAGGPWSARWMTPVEARYLANQKIGLPLGRLGGRLLRFKPGVGWRGGHHMLVAGTRAGKGVSGVLPAIIDHDGPVVALDIKGELFAVTRRWRRSLGQRVVVLNPMSVNEPSADRFNPLDYVRRDPDHITRDAELVADGLVKPEGGDGDHFSVMARNLIAAAVEVVVKVAEPSEQNLITVADMLGPNVVATLEAWRDSADVVGKPASRAAAAVLGAGDKERGSILTTVSKALAWTSSGPMERFLGASDFRLDELIDGKTDVFLVVPLDQVHALSGFLRLMVNIVAGVTIRQMGNRNLAKPLLLVLDEFTRLGRMQKLLDIATVAAGAGVEALFVTQDRAQIASVYRDGEADTLLGACATVRVFGLGRTDNATAQWVVAGVGDRTVQTYSKPLDGEKKGSESEQRSKLFTADQLLELPGSDMVALFSGRPPLQLKRIISHSDPAYRNKLDPNPTLRT